VCGLFNFLKAFWGGEVSLMERLWNDMMLQARGAFIHVLLIRVLNLTTGNQIHDHIILSENP